MVCGDRGKRLVAMSASAQHSHGVVAHRDGDGCSLAIHTFFVCFASNPLSDAGPSYPQRMQVKAACSGTLPLYFSFKQPRQIIAQIQVSMLATTLSLIMRSKCFNQPINTGDLGGNATGTEMCAKSSGVFKYSSVFQSLWTSAVVFPRIVRRA
jgi:hypothetical protein